MASNHDFLIYERVAACLADDGPKSAPAVLDYLTSTYRSKQTRQCDVDACLGSGVYTEAGGLWAIPGTAAAASAATTAAAAAAAAAAEAAAAAAAAAPPALGAAPGWLPPVCALAANEFQGRTVLVAGGGPAAEEARAELQARGAEVHEVPDLPPGAGWADQERAHLAAFRAYRPAGVCLAGPPTAAGWLLLARAGGAGIPAYAV